MRFLPFILVFIGGGLLGVFATSAMIEVAVPEVRPEPRATVTSDPSEADRAAGTELGTPVPAVAELDDPGELELIARTISAVATVDPGPRAGTIAGRVATFEGATLSGVEITASPGNRPDREDADALPEKVRRYIRDERWREGLEAKATSGPDGAFLLTEIGDVEYRVSAKAPGYKFEGRTRAVRAGDSIELTAFPVAQLEVTVVRPDGTEPRNAQVSIGRSNSVYTRNWSPKERTIDIDPGTVEVSASFEETERSEPVEVTAEIAAGPVPVRLVLRTRGAIEGEVAFPPDEFDGQAMVYLLPVALKPDARPEDLLSAEKKSWQHGRNRFVFSDLDPGGYWIGAARGHEYQGLLPSMQLVEVGDTKVQVEVPVSPLPIEEGVLVYSFAPNGTPLADVNVSLGYSTEGMRSWGGWRGGMAVRLRDGGVLVLTDQNLENGVSSNPGGRYSVHAQHASYGEVRAEIGTLRGQQVEMRFHDPARAVISIAGYVGSDFIGKIQVDLLPDDGIDDRNTIVWNDDGSGIDANGQLTLGPLTPGPHILRMQYIDRSGGNWSAGTLSEEPVTLLAGENRFNMAVPTLHSLTIVFPEGATGGSVQVRLADDDNPYTSRHAAVGEDGATIEGLVAGRYSVRAWGQGIKNGTLQVDVPASGPVLFEPQPVNALRIQVRDENGPLALAGFRSGDMIVKINGQPFEGEEQLAIMGVFLQGASEVTVTVDRGGEEIDLVLDPRKLMNGDPGGSVDPTVR